MDRTFGHQVVDEIAEAAHRHEQRDAPYLTTIRRAMARLAPTDIAPDDVRAALLSVEDSARIDLDVPTASRRRAVSAVKRGVKGLTGWYLRYLGDQVTLLGQATVRFGDSIANRTERLEETTGRLSSDVSALAVRLERLEAGCDGK